MAFLRTSIASRILVSCLRPTVRYPMPAAKRCYADDKSSSAPPDLQSKEERVHNPKDVETSYGGSTSVTRGAAFEEMGPPTGEAKEKVPRKPHYDVALDDRTSSFSPVPKRVMDGSEPGTSVAAAVLSGAPMDLQARTVRIYRPAKTATQSGDWHSHKWRMDWDPLPKGWRWENPLIGWQSSADYMNGQRLQFNTKEDAINFANKQGYEYFVQEPNERKFVPKAYANNFVHIPGKLKVIRTK